MMLARSLAVVLVLSATASADTPRKLKCDLSSEDAIAATYKKATGKTLSTYGGRCLARSDTFPAMAAVGSFASDRGCEWEGALHDCAWNDPKAAATEMAAAGWAKADAAKRGELAIAWLREVEHFHMDDPKSAMVGGKLVVSWVEVGPVGMRPVPPTRTPSKVTFEADGTHGKPM